MRQPGLGNPSPSAWLCLCATPGPCKSGSVCPRAGLCVEPALKSLLEKAQHSWARALLFQDNGSLAGLPQEGLPSPVDWQDHPTSCGILLADPTPRILLPISLFWNSAPSTQLAAPCPQERAPNIPLPASLCSQPGHATPSPSFEANYGSETSTVPRCTIPIRLCLKPINHHYKCSISEQVSVGRPLSCWVARSSQNLGLGETLLTPPRHPGVASQP